MTEQQLGFDLGDGEDTTRASLFDPVAVRADARAILAEARTAGADGPWDAAELKYRRIMFPHLVSLLPDEEERRQLCFDFTQEVERIARLLAA